MNRILIIAGIFFMVGCKTDPIVKPVPVIEISTPTNNQHFVVGDTIRITGTVTHVMALTEVAVHMTDQTTKMEFFHNHFSAGNTTSYTFNAKYGIPNNVKSSFQLEVEATDKDGNVATKEMLIQVN